MTHDFFLFVIVFFLQDIIAYKGRLFFMQRVMSCTGIKTVFPFRTVMLVFHTSNSVPLLPHIEMHILA